MRLALFPVALLLAGPATAQSTASVSAGGSGQHVLIDQSASDRSSVTIDQIGVAGGTVASQIGSDNSLRVSMNGDDQEHSVTQTSAGTARASIDALGDRNSSSIVQTVADGGIGEVALVQTGNDNRAELNQAVEASAANRLSLSQLGDANLARLTQQGSNNSLDLTQQGNGLVADITQRGNNLGFAMTQTGANTPITVIQSR